MPSLILLTRFMLAWLVCFTLASMAHSQFVLSGLSKQGIHITLSQRWQMSLSDWWGLLPTYGVVLAVGLLIAFGVATWLARRFTGRRVMLYSLAGFAGLLCIHLAMQPLMDITLIAGARGTLGLLTQAATGLIGGWVFAMGLNQAQKP